MKNFFKVSTDSESARKFLAEGIVTYVYLDPKDHLVLIRDDESRWTTSGVVISRKVADNMHCFVTMNSVYVVERFSVEDAIKAYLREH